MKLDWCESKWDFHIHPSLKGAMEACDKHLNENISSLLENFSNSENG